MPSFGEFLERIKRRANDPDFWKHNAESLFFGQEDLVCDYIPNTHPEFEKTLKEAKQIDKELLPIWPIGTLYKQVNRNKLENLKFERQPKNNCDGKRTIP